MDPIILTNKRVLVTGGTGFLGAHLVKKLVSLRAKVCILDSYPIEKQPLLNDFRNNVDFYKVDIRSFNKIKKISKDLNPEIIFHLCALIDRRRNFENIDKIVDVNLKGTINLLHALIDIDYDSFILTSTSEVYGRTDPPFQENMPLNPVSPYSASKASAEIFCKTFSEIYNKPFTILRLFNLYGEGQAPNMFIPQLINTCLDKQDFKMTKGEQTREFNYVEDVITGLLLASVTPAANREVINVGNGNEIQLKRIAEIIVELFGNCINLKLGAIDYRKNDIMRMYSDNSKAKKILNWHPEYSIEEGLKKTVNYYIRKTKTYIGSNINN